MNTNTHCEIKNWLLSKISPMKTFGDTNLFRDHANRLKKQK